MPEPRRLSVTSVRRARPEDLPLVQRIEAAADRRFADRVDDAHWPPAPTGDEGAGGGGFLLVVGQPAAGFARVVELGSGSRPHLHLERVVVHPGVAGRGLGTMLVLGALGEALDRGCHDITLTTFADVPWHGPWYARLGFTELDLDTPSGPRHAELAEDLRQLAEREPRLGPDPGRHARRIARVRELTDTPAPLSAVSVIPLRDGPRGLEVFVQHRTATMDFAPGAVVFPGGRVDPRDRAAGGLLPLPAGHATAQAHRWRLTAYSGLDGTSEERVRTLLATGVRELAEETGLVVAARRLVPWDNWVTPIGCPKRFDVSFFVLPVEQDALSHRTTEATDSEWLRLDELVGRTEARELALVPPTRTIVDELQRLGSVDAVLALDPVIRAVRHDVTPLRPRPPDGVVEDD